MPLPVGVQTGTVTFGSAVSFGGRTTTAKLDIEPSARLVYDPDNAGDGIPILDFIETATADDGQPGQMYLPLCDQAGFKATQNGIVVTITGWSYKGTLTWTDLNTNKSKSVTKVFQINTGQQTIDFDRLPDTVGVLPVTAPTVGVQAFLGKTGNITETDLADLDLGGGAPTSENVAPLLTTPGPAKTALDQSYASQSGLRLGSPSRIPAAPVNKMFSASKAGHGWEFDGAADKANVNLSASNLNSTEHVLLGDRSVKLVTNGQGAVEAFALKNISTYTIDNEDPRIWVWIDGGVATLKAELVDSTMGASIGNNLYAIGGVSDLSGFGLQKGRWNIIDIPRAALEGSGSNNIAQVRVTITDTGTPAILHVSAFGLTEAAHTGMFPNGVFHIGADDCDASQWTQLRPRLDAYGYRATLYPIIDQLGAPGNLTLAQVVSLHDDYGWEIGAHASTGAIHAMGWNNMTSDQRRREAETIKAWQDSMGFASTSFAYPLGSGGLAAERDAARYFSTARHAFFGLIEPQYPANPYRMQPINAGTQPIWFDIQIPRMVASKCRGGAVYHAIKETGLTGNDVTPAQLDSQLASIDASGITVLPMGEATSVLAA